MSEQKQKQGLALALAMGTELIVTVLAGIFAGYYGGRYVNFAEWGAVIGCIAGFSVWVWRMMLTQRNMK